MDSGNPLKALETFINTRCTLPSSNITTGFSTINNGPTTNNYPKFHQSNSSVKDENYRTNFHSLLYSSELQLEDFLENFDSQQPLYQHDHHQHLQHIIEEEEYNEPPSNNTYEPLQYSPPYQYQNQQQLYTVNFNIGKINNNFDEFEQQRQRKRNEEIARILSPIQKLKQHNKQNSIKSNIIIRRKFSLLNGPCKQKKTHPKPAKYNNSMKEWQEKIIPIIQQQVSFKTELL